ncbi:MAG: cyclase family protein [Defluviicoccus sp.]|nr:cyclase family protein [Defluviicoccus sp.]MDE0386256.1 cyclase family protein [Defluviicoccus sp.]
MRIVDLTLPINRDMRPMPQLAQYRDNPTRCIALTALSEAQAATLAEQRIELADGIEIAHHMTSKVEILTHIGTHIDAPRHFIDGGRAVDEIPLESLVKPGRVIPLTHIEPGGSVTAEAILETGVAFDGTVIPILHTAWTDRAWGTDAYWDDVIYMDVSVSRLLVERGVSAVAIDFHPEIPFWRTPPAPDLPPGPNHRTLLGNGTTIVQMVTNVGAIGAEPFLLAAIPLRLERLDGSPARVFAMVDGP